ncbi:hypothetical protein CHS0354_008570 [Potamilus streckersoni]|uniref:Uncharacterized protein n=1 Tax=Potamilus streckersoni TaxID=2493646 RepID=A0AAE0RSB3_9BIVA|nr:hypothetical protein CHS0354_008570 [Potamilus streckersoni]
MADKKGIQGQLSADLGLFRESDNDKGEEEEASILSEQLDTELHKLQEMVLCLENLERELDLARHSKQTTISVPSWINSRAVQKTYSRAFESLKEEN